MPIVDIEIAPDRWVSLNVTYSERREIMLAAPSSQRFVDTQDHRVKIVHSSNPLSDPVSAQSEDRQ